MKLIRNSIVAGIAFTAMAVAACSSQHGATGTGPGSNGGGTDIGSNTGAQGSFGSVGMHLDIGTPPNGATVTSLNWTITNGTNTYTGTNTVGNAQSFEFVQGGIAAGTGYTVTLSGTDSNGDPCNGTSAPFTIVAGAVTQTTLAVTCVQPNGDASPANVTTGTVEVDASVTLVPGSSVTCPGIGSFSISPAEIAPGQSAALTEISVGPASTLTWSVAPAGGGTFGNANSANTTFVCSGTAPQVTVTATVGLTDSGACAGQTFTTQSALVNCEGPTVVVDSGPPDVVVADVTPPQDVITPPTCVAECPASNPACSLGETQGVGFPGCNQTEALFNAHVPSGTNTTGLNCLQCALNAGCLHDQQGDAPPNVFDCEDLATGNDSFDGGTTSNLSACLNVLSCELPSNCGVNNTLYCYCGEGVDSTTCKTTQTGACIPQITFGLESTDPNFIQANFSSIGTNLPGAIADKALLCARNNCATQCF